jgi:CRP/FNR family cyclic AMP-dependent transcriptional regulator
MEQKLEKIRLFKKLTVMEMARVMVNMDRSLYEPGEFIFQQDDDSTSFHIIGSGLVEVFSVNKENDQIIELIKLGAGTTIGEVGFIDGRERTATVKCIQPTLTLSLTKNKFAEMIETEPEIALKILKEIGTILSERLRWCDKFLVSNNEIKIGRNLLSAIETSSH